MSSYFDAIDREVSDLADRTQTDEAFLAGVEEIEQRMIDQVTLVTGDREFPADLREKILSLIAVYETRTRVPGVPTKGRSMSLTLRQSWLSQELHSVFHAVARRRITTRFGMLYDSPSDILLVRNAWEKGETR